MLELFIRPRARMDLKGIWAYTAQTWGPDQADRYLQELDLEIQRLRECPDLGEKYDHVRAGYRMLPANHHRVFYRVDPARLEIVRVLHESMDLGSRL